jgi:hypothetical protein
MTNNATEKINRSTASLGALADQGHPEIAAKLSNLVALLAEEAARTPRFRKELALALADPAPASSLAAAAPAPRARPAARSRRAPAAFDPVEVFRADGEAGLRVRLAALDAPQLKDIIAEYGMDPTGQTSRLRLAAKLQEHIVGRAIARAEKGSAFRS